MLLFLLFNSLCIDFNFVQFRHGVHQSFYGVVSVDGCIITVAYFYFQFQFFFLQQFFLQFLVKCAVVLLQFQQQIRFYNEECFSALYCLFALSCWPAFCHAIINEYWLIADKHGRVMREDKKLSYRGGTARCVLSVVILPIATQQCRYYVYDKSWPYWWYEVGDLVKGNVSWTMCTQPWRDRVGCHCLRCHKQNDNGRIVYITCIPTTCCGGIF